MSRGRTIWALRRSTSRSPEYASFAVADGDRIVIGQRYQRSSNKVTIEGAVYNSGTYAIDDNVKTVKQLIEAAEGLREDAFLDRALLQREMPDWSLEMESFDLNELYSGQIADIPLRPNDELYIAPKVDMREEYIVTVSGPVALPGDYLYAEGMTIKDLIVKAGGLLESASLVKVDVSRRIKSPMSTEFSPVRSQLFTVSLGEGLMMEDGKDLVLEPFDQIYIRKVAGIQRAEPHHARRRGALRRLLCARKHGRARIGDHPQGRRRHPGGLP